MKNRCYSILYLLALLLCEPSLAQETAEKRPLITILEELQGRFEVRFNYASDLLEEITVAIPNKESSLPEIVEQLRQDTGLDFVFLSQNAISIKARATLLCGYVRDKDSNEPLSYTTIQSNGKGTVTDEEGFFELALQGISQTIVIRHIGHRTIRREAHLFDTSQCGTIHMVAEQQKLPEIILSQYLIRGMDKLDNGAFQLDFDQFSILPGLVEKDVLQSVQALPGILSIDETVSNINIRGGSNDQNLILWDNIKMYQSGHFFGLISMFNPQITQKVALQKNGTPSSFTDGVSGTIAMSTDKNINPALKGSLGINLIDANGFVDAPLGENASVQVAARKAISDFFETPTYSEYFSRIAQDTEIEVNDALVTNSDIEFDFYDASLRFLYRPSDKDFLRLNFIHTANEVVFTESAEVGNNQVERESGLDQTSIAAGFFYQRQWNDRFKTEIDIYNTDYKLRGINANVLQDQRFLQENLVSETGARFVAQNELQENFILRSGYQFIETKVTNLDDVDNPIFRRLEGELLRTHGVFSELDWSSSNRNTYLNVGVRFNYLDKFRRQLWEPRLSFNHRFLKYFNLEVLGEFKHQNTSQIINFQNDFLGIERRRWQLSNDMDIPVIQSKQGSLGLSYQESGWLINTVGFLKEVDGITTKSQGFLDSFEFVRTSGRYDAFGVDFLLRKQLQKWNLWLSYGYLNSGYDFDELPETEFRSNFDITHSITSGITFSTSKLNLAIGGNWRTGKPFTPPLSNNEVVDGEINYGMANSNELDDFIRLDFSAIYSAKIGKKTSLRTGVSIWNLLNRENPINTFFRVNPQNEAQQILQRSLGITPNASLKLLFF
ncbi:TonB-dependent receptor [Flagellimonas sp.]|uniref:TonB-dependent receptor n=1 Tax=Flagellimonas sp. TaxID=2058762 RepID=UPI003F4A783E